MPHCICLTCGVQYAEQAEPPDRCLICTDDRQYVRPEGQAWTTLAEMRTNYANELRAIEPGLTGIVTAPKFAIGQRPLLVQTPGGNVLWDCISFIDDATVEAVNALGGIDAIAISHPHFYDSMIEWSRAFGGAPVYLHAADRQWVMRPDPAIVFWDGATHALSDEITLIRCGGHFPGSSVLHWSVGAEGRGVLLTADTIMVVADTRYVTFMHSFPNQVPLNAAAVQGIVDAIAPFNFDRIYSGWWEKVTAADGKRTVIRSAERYIRAIQ